MVDYCNNPAVNIFADTEAAMARMRRTAEASGCRVVSATQLGDGFDPSATPGEGAAILIEIENEATGKSAIPLLDWLQREAESGRRRGLVSAPLGLIDLAAASADHAGIELLCEATEAERLAAIARAVGPVASRVRDDGGVGGARL